MIDLVLHGLLIGGVYSLIALRIVLIYKSTGVFNFAQGQFVAICAFFCWSCWAWMHMPIWLAVMATLAFGALLGLIVDRTMFRPVIGQPLIALIMITIALSTLLDGILTGVWRGCPRAYPEFLPSGAIELAGSSLAIELLLLFVVSLGLFGVFFYFFRSSQMGLNMRAVAEDHQSAQGVGIDVKRVFSNTWVLSAVMAAVAGILLGSYLGAAPGLVSLAVTAFAVAILGGLDSVPGAIVGGLIVGVAENVGSFYLDPIAGGETRLIIPLALMIIVMFFRPYGLFGLKRIERI